MKKNLLKEKLSKGEAAFGVLIQEPAFQIVETLGILGFDYLYIDCLHSHMSVESVAHLVRAAEIRGMTAIVRSPQNIPNVILRYLDVGVMGITVPDMNSVEEAQKVVKAVKYPPLGERGLGPVRANDFGLTGPMGEYVQMANAETLALGVVEDREGIERIEEILRDGGLDGVSVGASDLSKSLGVPGQTSHPLVQEAMNKVLAAAKKTGKSVGAVVRAGETPKQYVDRGFRMISITLTKLLADASRQFFESVKG